MPKHQFYGELAEWWPLVSPVDEYTEEAGFFADLIRGAENPVNCVLELGSGGGHNAFHMKAYFKLTLVDISDEMLAVSSLLNPECEHSAGDMRSARLGRDFDAVFVHDAVDYMASADELSQVIETAFHHCRPGGIAVFAPDRTKETFKEEHDCDGNDDDNGRGVRYLEWTWDPDPGDDWALTEYSFLLRETDGSVRAVHETHRIGVFSRERWLKFIAEAGFESEAITEVTTEDREPREVFVGRRPTRRYADRARA